MKRNYKKELNPVEKILRSSEDEKKHARKRVLSYYKKRAPIHFLTIAGGWTIFVLTIFLFTENPSMGLEGGILIGILIYAIIYTFSFFKDMKNPEEFCE